MVFSVFKDFQAPWGATFGSLTDKFGIAWIFNFGD